MSWTFWKIKPRSPFTAEQAYNAALRVLKRNEKVDGLFTSYEIKCKRIEEWRKWADAQEDRVVRRAYQRWLDYFQREADESEKDRLESEGIDNTVKQFPRLRK